MTEYTAEQIKENRREWVDALRSGQFKQTKGKLKARNGAMCCLGVLAQVAGCEFYYDASEDGYGADNLWGYAPRKAMEFVGLTKRDGDFLDDNLADRNDEGASFAQIATIIESEPAGPIPPAPSLTLPYRRSKDTPAARIGTHDDRPR